MVSSARSRRLSTILPKPRNRPRALPFTIGGVREVPEPE